MTNLEVTKKLLNVAKSKIKLSKNVKIKFVTDRPGHDLRYALNSTKLIKTLNWKPKTSFKKGLELTFMWYLKNIKYFNSLSKKDIIRRIGKIS